MNESPRAQQVGWLVDDELRRGAAEAAVEADGGGPTGCAMTRAAVLERPHDPLFGDIAELDELSVQDRIDERRLRAGDADVVDGIWSTLL